MSQKTPEFTRQPRTNLVVEFDEAHRLLSERIKLGKELSSRDIQNVSDLRKCWTEFHAWGDFNSELLKRIFDTDEFFNYYNPVVVVASGYAEDLTSGTLEFIEEVEYKTSKLESILGRLELIPTVNASSAVKSAYRPQSKQPSNKVFLVHGHDNEVLQTVARFIERLELEPIILHEQPSRSRTLIEKIEAHADVAYAVVLLTPDDVGGLGEEDPELKPRARQNVIFEMGFFFGYLARENVAALYKAGVELPSDYQGIVYIAMDGSDPWQTLLARELESAGIKFNHKGLI